MLKEFLDNIPFGKAPLLIIIITVLSGTWLLFNPVQQTDADLRLWTFVHSNHIAYKEIAEEYTKDTPDFTIEIQNINYFALQNRLRSAFWADLDVPDIVELEISHAGGFFRGKKEDIGFLDLTPYLKRDGLFDRMVKSRFAPYQNRGGQFGLPLDLHPVVIAYRRDLFEEYGIDPDSLKTWDDFIREGKRISVQGERYMVRLPDSNANYFETFLFQNNGGYFDPEGKLIMDNEVALKTLLWYIPLVAGPEKIGNDLGTDQVFAQALEGGYFLSLIAPDWLAHHISLTCPQVEGKMAIMPLPAFEPGGRRTSTMGGTMMGITKACKDPDKAWDFAKAIRLDPKKMGERFREHGIIPPFKEAWELEEFSEPKPYWSNQKIGEIFASVADQVPPQYASPYVAFAKSKMGEAVSACSTYYNENGEDGFEEFARKRLKQAADEVRRTMTRNPFQ